MMKKYFDNFIPRIPTNESFVEKIRVEAISMLDEPILSLPYSSFKIFFETGSRVEYEQL